MAAKARMLDLARLGSAAFDRRNVEPGHFTASAFVVTPSRDEVLLIHHGKLERWLQPGGHVDAQDASLEAAALREVVEETSLTALEPVGGIFDVDIHRIPARGETAAHEHFDVRFLFVTHQRTARAASDALAARWFTLDEVSVANSDESVLRAVRKLNKSRLQQAADPVRGTSS